MLKLSRNFMSWIIRYNNKREYRKGLSKENEKRAAKSAKTAKISRVYINLYINSKDRQN